MPVIDIKLNLTLTEATLQALAAEFASTLGRSFERACPKVMVSFDNGPLFVNGSSAPAAWVVVRSAVGLPVEAKRNLCQRFAESLAAHADIAPERLFLLVSSVPPEDTWNMTASGPICVAERLAVEESVAKGEAVLPQST